MRICAVRRIPGRLSSDQRPSARRQWSLQKLHLSQSQVRLRVLQGWETHNLLLSLQPRHDPLAEDTGLQGLQQAPQARSLKPCRVCKMQLSQAAFRSCSRQQGAESAPLPAPGCSLL